MRKICRACDRERAKRYYQANRERVIKRVLMSQYRHDGERTRARNRLCKAVQEGRVKKPSHCETCGAAGTVIHGHHEDYSKPFDVQWLCPACHGKLHRKYA